MERRWIFPSNDRDFATNRLSSGLNIPPFLARILIRNGFGDLEAATAFLEPRLRGLADPFLLPEMEKATDRIRHAIQAGERIVLYGDYDVDGVASLALLNASLTIVGGKVTCFLPLRAQDGYG